MPSDEHEEIVRRSDVQQPMSSKKLKAHAGHVAGTTYGVENAGGGLSSSPAREGADELPAALSDAYIGP
jgi:hypothetical protein